MKSLFKVTLIAFLTFYLPLKTFAWGLLGHRVVAEVADHHLSAKARKEIAKIIGPGSIAMEANWLDFIKSDKAYNYLYNWHFINMPSGWNFEQAVNFMHTDTNVNAYNRIKFAATELKKKDLPQEKKILYLRILLHVVGDIHQPMHVGHLEDKGGNDVKLTWFNKPTNLHAVWDEALIESQELSYTEYAKAIDHPTKTQVYEWQNDTLEKWLYSSYTIASELYKEAETNTKLSYRYNFDHVATMNEQLLKGGVRLAKLLNDIFS